MVTSSIATAALKVVFATKGGQRFPGHFHFKNGLCASAEMEGGGDWANPDNSPINGVRFLLDFGDEKLHATEIDEGRVFHIDDPMVAASKGGFLANFRVARNLFVHSQQNGSVTGNVGAAPDSESLARAAIWLTPRSVAGFNAADFSELGHAMQAQLLAAVQSFKAVAVQVPSDKPATKEQYGNASVAFAKILEILKPYLPIPDEGRQVEEALRNVEYPSWVVNWDYELDSDSDGVAAVWVNVFADERTVPIAARFGRARLNSRRKFVTRSSAEKFVDGLTSG